MNILVVDDDSDIRETIAEVLETDGHRALLAANGEKALKLLDDEAGKLDLVLLDLRMPGIDGSQVAERIGDAIPIVVITSEAGLPSPPNAVDRLNKPFSIDQLRRAVKAHAGLPS